MTLRASSRPAVQSRFARIFRSLLLGLLTAHAATTHAVADNTRDAPGRPKLIVLITIDGLPQRQVLSYRNQLAPDGFNRFLQRGSWFANAYITVMPSR
jgi:hypothetical protein